MDRFSVKGIEEMRFHRSELAEQLDLSNHFGHLLSWNRRRKRGRYRPQNGSRYRFRSLDGKRGPRRRLWDSSEYF